MSYTTVAQSSRDQALIDRITAATEQEAWNTAAADTDYGRLVQQSSMNAIRMIWPVCAATDIEAAYASALAANTPNPGGDPAVITDAAILTSVQAKWPPDPA